LILRELSANNIKEKIIKREITAQEVVEDLFEWIDLKEPSIKAYLCLDKEGALLKAKEIDEKISNGGKVGLLAGIPVAIKDNICTSGMKNKRQYMYIGDENHLRIKNTRGFYSSLRCFCSKEN